MSLITLQRGPSAPPPQGPLGLLLACHERIRRFALIASRLADPALPADERMRGAVAVHRYFTVAMPLHVLDEELSIAPRLLALPLPAATHAAARTMLREHGPLDALISEVAPAWQALADLPAHHARHQAVLTRVGQALVRDFEPHLHAEETLVFPALASLPPEEQVTILGELHARRRDLPPAGTARQP
jgi:hypothetical protein